MEEKEESPITGTPGVAAGPPTVDTTKTGKKYNTAEQDHADVDDNIRKLRELYDFMTDPETLDTWGGEDVTTTNTTYRIIQFPTMMDAADWFNETEPALEYHLINTVGLTMDEPVRLAVKGFGKIFTTKS